MKTPEAGTEVFSPVARTGTGSSATVTTPGFPPDMLITARRDSPDWPTSDRLRGVGQNLGTCYTSAENTPSPAYVESYNMTGATLGTPNAVNGSGLDYINYFFRRAPGFFDVVCYTGTGTASTNTVKHNLTVIPELIIIKNRNSTQAWGVMHSFGATTLSINYLNTGAAEFSSDYATIGWVTEKPTASQFVLDDVSSTVNTSGNTYVAYLFASVSGVSKVGVYTGTATTLQINCGFTSGARFVMIKRLDASAGWFVYDSARGIVSGNDPYLRLNLTSAEVTDTDQVDTYSSGFELSSSAPPELNADGGTYIFFAIA
jgi:hypothetical protein